jgi:hypothetical protein
VLGDKGGGGAGVQEYGLVGSDQRSSRAADQVFLLEIFLVCSPRM